MPNSSQLSSGIKKILMIAPKDMKGSYWNMERVYTLLGKKFLSPPLGLMHIAGLLPREHFEIRLVDMNIDELHDADLVWADYVFISCMSTATRGLDTVLERAKKANRPTVLGGPHATSNYTIIKSADCLVIGEAETVWSHFLADLMVGTLKKAYVTPISEEMREHALACWGDDAHVSEAGCLPDMEGLPSPRYDLVDLNNYYLVPLQTTRGCPARCEFCDIWTRFGRRPRHRSPERVIADLDELYRLGWRGTIFFADDNFIGDKEYARTLLTAIAKWQTEHRRPFGFAGEGSLDLTEDTRMLELCAAAKFIFLFVGLETPNVKGLEETNKYINLKGDMEQRVAILQQYGIHVTAAFIVGFDADPEDIAGLMADAAGRMGIPLVMVSILLALPHTVLTEKMKDAGRLFVEEVPRYPASNSHTFIPNFRTQKPLTDVAAAYRSVLDRLYAQDMESYFDRCRTFLFRYSNEKKSVRAIIKALLPGVKAKVPNISQTAGRKKGVSTLLFLRLFWDCMKNPYRRHAFSFLLGIWRHRREHMSLAVGLVAEANHFWFTTRTYLQAATMWDFMRDQAQQLAAQGVSLPNSSVYFGIDNLRTGAPQKEVLVTGADAKKLRDKILADVDTRYSLLPELQQEILYDHYATLRDEIQAAG